MFKTLSHKWGVLVSRFNRKLNRLVARSKEVFTVDALVTPWDYPPQLLNCLCHRIEEGSQVIFTAPKSSRIRYSEILRFLANSLWALLGPVHHLLIGCCL